MVYILDENKNPVKVDDILEWARWFETSDRHVSDDLIGDDRVSTVFLGLNHSHGGGEPILFETMVFGGPLDQEQYRCSTWDQAVKMHSDTCRKVRETTKPKC